MGDPDYIHAFQRIVMPIAMEFAPELVISAFKFPSIYDPLTISCVPHSLSWV